MHHEDNFYQYSNTMMQAVDGLIDSIQSTSLPEREKLKIHWNMEKQTEKFVLQNYLIGDWMDKLWYSTGINNERYLSSLYAVSVSKPWNIGWFVDTDPKLLKQDYENVREDLNSRILWRMMRRNIQDISATTLKPQKDAFVQNISKIVEKRFS